MTISEFKKHLVSLTEINFITPNNTTVPPHFHITEAGLSTKNFIDCGGTVRTEKVISFQVWVANDVEHRLAPNKLINIIEIASPLLGNEDLEIEIEYQTETISRYGLEFNGKVFVLTRKQTDCLAKDKCGIPQQKTKVRLSDLQSNTCEPGGTCC